MALFALSITNQKSNTNVRESVRNDAQLFDYDNTRDHMDNSRSLLKQDSMLESIYGDLKPGNSKNCQNLISKSKSPQERHARLPVRNQKKRNTKSLRKESQVVDIGNNDQERGVAKLLYKYMKEYLLDKENRVRKKSTKLNKKAYQDEDEPSQSENITGRKVRVRRMNKPINFIKLRAWYNSSEINKNKKVQTDEVPRVVQRFINIHDSESEHESFDYHDFQPRWYSIYPRSNIAQIITVLKELSVFVGAIFFPLELVYYDKTSFSTVFFHSFLELTFTSTYLLGFFIGYEERRNKLINYNLASIFNHNLGSQNVLWAYYEQLVIIFNHLTYSIIASFSFSSSSKLLLDLFIISKFLLFMNLNEWVVLNPILKNINDVMLKHFSSKNQGSILVGLIKFLASLKVLAYYLIFIHTASCLWIYIYQYTEYYNSNDHWVFYLGYGGLDFQTLYIISFYYCLTTFVSVGYGDIHPYTNRERIFGIAFMFLGVLFYSFLISLLSSLVVRDQSKRAVFLDKKKVLDEINGETKLEEELYNRINNSLAHSAQTSINDKLLLVENLPSNLKDTMLFAIHDRIIQNLNYFKGVSKNFVLFTCSYLKVQFYERNFKILSAGQKITEMFFILKGNVSLCLSERQDMLRLAIFNEGENFLDNFMEGEDKISQYNALTKASSNEIVCLSKDNYILIKNNFPLTVDSRRKETQKRNEIVENLTKSSLAYFSKFGTMQNFKRGWLKKVKIEIEKDLDIYSSDDEDEPNYDFSNALTSIFKSPKSKMKSNSALLTTDKKKNDLIHVKTCELKRSKHKSNLKEVIASIKPSKKKQAKEVISKQYREDINRIETGISSNISPRFSLTSSPKNNNNKLWTNQKFKIDSAKPMDFRKSTAKVFIDDDKPLVIFFNNVGPRFFGASNCSYTKIKQEAERDKTFDISLKFMEDGYKQEIEITSNKFISEESTFYQPSQESKIFLIQIKKVRPSISKEKVQNLAKKFQKLILDIKNNTTSSKSLQHHQISLRLGSSDTSRLNLLFENYSQEKDNPPNIKRVLDISSDRSIQDTIKSLGCLTGNLESSQSFIVCRDKANT